MSTVAHPQSNKDTFNIQKYRNVTPDLVKEVTSKFISQTLTSEYTDSVEDDRFSQTQSKTRSRFAPALSPNEILACEFHPSGSQVAYSRVDGSLTVWEFENSNGLFTQNCRYNLTKDVINSEKVVTDLSWNPTETDQLAATSNSNEILVWSVDNVRNSIIKMKTLQVPGSKTKVYKCDYSPNGKWLLCSTKNELLYLFSVNDEYRLDFTFDIWTALGYQSSVTSLVWSNNGSHIFIGLKNGKIILLEVAKDDENVVSLRVVFTIDAHRNSISSLKMDPQGRFLLAGSMDGTCSAWDTSNLCCVYTINNIDAAVVSLDINHLGSILVVSTGDDKLYFHNANDGSFINSQSLEGLKSDMVFRFHPNKTWYILSSTNDTLSNHTASYADELTFWKKEIEASFSKPHGKGRATSRDSNKPAFREASKSSFRDSNKSVPSGPSHSGERKSFRRNDNGPRTRRPAGPRGTRYDNR